MASVCPNPREWNRQDVENWFETEAGVSIIRGIAPRIAFTQTDRRPLEKDNIKCRIYYDKTTGVHYANLDMIASAKFAKIYETRVKTQKACQDIQRVKQAIMKPRKRLSKEAAEARRRLHS